MRSRVAALLLVFIVACDEATHRATGVTYAGAPLAVVNGRMTAERTIALQGDVRLAVGWFSSGKPGSSQPDAVQTQSLVYEPVFPTGFSFGIYDLPQVGSSGTIEGPGGVVGSAIGVLFAYDDRNRNGTLDGYRPPHAPIDAVLGTSLGKIGPTPDPTGFCLVLITDLGAPGISPNLHRGLNLVRLDGTPVGFNTPVPIHLDGAPELNLFTCQGVFGDAGSSCFEQLHPPPDAGTLDAGLFDAGLEIFVGGAVGLSNSAFPSAELTVTVGGSNRPDATVELNGVPLVYSAAVSRFQLPGSAPVTAVKVGEENVVQVSASGAAPLKLGFFMPGNFSISQPAFNAAVSSSTGFDVAWTDSRDAGTYAVSVYRSSPFSSVFMQDQLRATSFTVPAIAYQGSANLTVEASVPRASGANGSFIVPYVNQSLPIRLQ